MLASGTHRLLTLAGGWRLCAGDVFVEEWEKLRNSSAGALDGCLWLKYYSLKSRSPELGLRPGSASVRGKRAGGCSPLMLSSGNPGGMGWGPVPYQQMPSLSSPPPPPPRPPGLMEGVNCVQGKASSVVPGKHYIRQEFPGHFSILGQCSNPVGPEPRIDARSHPRQPCRLVGCAPQVPPRSLLASSQLQGDDDSGDPHPAGAGKGRTLAES